MTQDIILWALVAGLIGLMWVLVLARLSENHHGEDRRKKSNSPGHSDGYEPGEGSFHRSRAAA